MAKARIRDMSLLYNTEVVAVESLGPYSVWLRFADGAEGKVDLSSELEDPVWEGGLERWHDPAFFDAVQVGGSGIVWGVEKGREGFGDEVSFSRDWLYAEVRGLGIVDMYPESYAVKVVEALPLEKYRVHIRFADGTEGEVDLEDFAGRGVFRRWDIPGVWEGMRVNRGTLEWGPDDPREVLDFSPEMLYSRASGISRDQMESPSFARAALARLTGN